MQIWLFFVPGAGGDGIANLLEHAVNVTPIDGNKDWWRVHRIVNGSTKFYAPNIDLLGCFRHGQPFDSEKNTLLDQYVNTVGNGLTTVVTSHDITLRNLQQSHSHNILLKNQIKVLLNTNNYQQASINFATKNLQSSWNVHLPKIDKNKFDLVLDMQKLQENWDYLIDFCKQLDINLTIDQYHCYQQVAAGNTDLMSNNFGIEQYQANINNHTRAITYKKIGVWNLQ